MIAVPSERKEHGVRYILSGSNIPVDVDIFDI
jgi:hypothetical protein